MGNENPGDKSQESEDRREAPEEKREKLFSIIVVPVFILNSASCLLVSVSLVRRFLLIRLFDGVEHRAGTLHMNLDFQNLVK